MYSSSSFLTTLLATWVVRLTTAETFVIEAGDVYFKPSRVNASAGDILEFRFLPNNHSVVMGDLSSPCQPISEGGFYSGFLPASADDGDNSQAFQVTINNTDPFAFYCSQNASSHNHCKAGMYGFVNQPDQDAIQMYSAAANDSSINISPDGDAFGGILAANSNTTNETNTTATTTSSPTATNAAESSSTNTGAPINNSGAGVKASGLFAIAMALMMG